MVEDHISNFSPPRVLLHSFFYYFISPPYNLIPLHGNHRVAVIEGHRIVEISGSLLYADRSLGFWKEWIVVLVETRQKGNWVWSVERAVVVGGGMPVVGVVVTPEAIVVISWKAQPIIMPGVSSYQKIHF